MGTMKLWQNRVIDTVVARDPDHASEICASTYGEPYNVVASGEWTERAPDAPLSIVDGDAHLTKTGEEWIATLPEGGFLCSTEW